jgi:Na+-transporting NADH:ubiquinone oxidoreductase subunit A
MSKDIKIKKGLDIKLQGEPTKEVKQVALSNTFIVYPEDFHSIVPKLVVKVGTKVQKGDTLFFNKSNEQMKFVSPTSGEVKDIVRGAKRKVLQIVIAADGNDNAKDFGKKSPADLSQDQIKTHLLESGCWSFIKQRPYDVIANPEKEIRDIFISGFSTAPLAIDMPFALQGKEANFQTGIDALSKLTNGKIHLSVQGTSFLNQINGVETHKVSGVHPAGNVGTQIN